MNISVQSIEYNQCGCFVSSPDWRLVKNIEGARPIKNDNTGLIVGFWFDKSVEIERFNDCLKLKQSNLIISIKDSKSNIAKTGNDISTLGNGMERGGNNGNFWQFGNSNCQNWKGELLSA